ncbi:MAG: hypothetical protein ACREQL_12895 [Candidatus Binatia bacterium]
MLATTLGAPPAVAGPPLVRDLGAYIVFGLRNVGLKNVSVQGACNTGVDCAHPNPNSSCGIVSHENAHYGEGSQIAGDRAQFNRPGADVWQLVSNDVTTLANVTIGLPPIEPLAPLPILGDADGDGAPSCSVASGQCVVDPGDLAAACGFPTPFPTCDATNEVLVLPGLDCALGADLTLGNGRCDLAPGTYGKIAVQNGGKLTLQGGAYVLCALAIGQSAEVIADAPTVLDVAGDVSIGNDASLGPAPGQECGKITVHASGPGSVTFGRQAKVNGFFCGPERLMRLGHDNDLTGRFFADVVDADDNNRAFCCQSAAGVCEVPGPGAPLRREFDAYFALAQRAMSVKDLQLDSPCNVGVNCASVTQNGSCGVLAMADATFGTGTQVVGDKVFFRKGGVRLWQLFRNDGGPLTGVELLAPPETPFAPPVIPGTCDAACQPDVAALEAACGFPASFPPCDPLRPIRALPLADCQSDSMPGNQRCDLAPGVYGRLSVMNGARLALGPGQYVFCSVKIGREAAVEADATTILLPTGGSFKAGNGSEVGQDCGDLTVLKQGFGVVSFGRHALIASRVCAPQAYLRLGHGNTLIGQFVADTVTSDSNNQGRCCCPDL